MVLNECFSLTLMTKKTSEYEIIDLKRIISELRNDNKYKELIYELE